ncbi:MAG: GNAT family N-acetyltransferase, partial [Ilumatobacteraceae bacterium]
ITALINTSEAFDGVPRILEADELREELEAPEVDLASDSRLAIIAEGDLVGWIHVRHSPTGEVQEKAFIDGTVLPARRGQGIGRTLMEWAVPTARARLEAIDNDLPKFIRLYAYEQIEDLQRLVARFGFTPVRWFEELLMPLDVRPAPTTPAGIDIVAWPAGGQEEARQVKNIAFADHWGSTPSSAADWDQRVNGFGGRPDLSFVALDADGVMVGICLSGCFPADEALTGRRDAWVDTLATLSEWRGKGVASALISHSLAAFAAADFTHSAIGVDSSSPTGASRLYRSLGYELQHRQVVGEIQVA